MVRVKKISKNKPTIELANNNDKKIKKLKMESAAVDRRRLSNNNNVPLRRTRSVRASLKQIGTRWLNNKLSNATSQKQLMDKSLSTSDIHTTSNQDLINNCKPFLSPQKDSYNQIITKNSKNASNKLLSKHKTVEVTEPPLIVPRKAALILQIPVVNTVNTVNSVNSDKENLKSGFRDRYHSFVTKIKTPPVSPVKNKYDVTLRDLHSANGLNNNIGEFGQFGGNNEQYRVLQRHDGFIRSSMRLSTKRAKSVMIHNSSFSASTSSTYFKFFLFFFFLFPCLLFYFI